MALSLGKESSLTYLAKINSFRSISLNKLTLRGQTKVNAQWQLYCLVHNIEKLQNTIH
ncbi:MULTISPECIES: transposase [Pseudoalteromonas]|uniref:transposase n=1 Tax=Pseudoalteromonas sp. SG43-7 TaxID=2760966 RepID=UPI001FEAAA0F|nr:MULTISPECIES: transposase [Pseudoalteromonas]